MSTHNIPSLHCLSVDVSLSEALLTHLDNEKKRYEMRLAKESAVAELRGSTPNHKYWYDRTVMAENDLEIARDLITGDFGGVELCTKGELKACLQRVVKQSVELSTPLQTPRNDFFNPEIVELDEEQSNRITQEYEQYVSKHSNNALVELWTREDDTTVLEAGYRTAPHQIFDYYMLLNVRMNTNANENFNPADPLTEEKTAWTKIRELYELVISAPRAPFPLLLVRTVRHEFRTPIAWFKALTKREMNAGDSIITPTFLSTSLHSMRQNWEMYGADAPQAAYDDVEAQRNCCIVQILMSKGVPMLPLGDFESNEHQYEQEVLLPPGIQLVLLDRQNNYLDDEIKVYSFLARVVPPPSPLS